MPRVAHFEIYTDNPEAYQLYLKGRYYWNKRNAEALKKSIEYFNQAIEKDPKYALAHAGLADAYRIAHHPLAEARGNVPPRAFERTLVVERDALLRIKFTDKIGLMRLAALIERTQHQNVAACLH